MKSKGGKNLKGQCKFCEEICLVAKTQNRKPSAHKRDLNKTLRKLVIPYRVVASKKTIMI